MNRTDSMIYSRQKSSDPQGSETDRSQKIYSANEKLQKQLLKPLQVNNRVRMRAEMGEANPDRMLELNHANNIKNYDPNGKTLIENFCETRKIVTTFDREKRLKKPKKVVDHLKDNISQNVYRHIKLIKDNRAQNSDIAFVKKSSGVDDAIKKPPSPEPKEENHYFNRKGITNDSLSHKAEYRFTDRKVLLWRMYEHNDVNPHNHDFVAETLKFNKEKHREMEEHKKSPSTSRVRSPNRTLRPSNTELQIRTTANPDLTNRLNTNGSVALSTQRSPTAGFTPRKPMEDRVSNLVPDTSREEKFSRTFSKKVDILPIEEHHTVPTPSNAILNSNTSRKLNYSNSGINIAQTIETKMRTEFSTMGDETLRDKTKHKFDENPLRLALLANLKKAKKRHENGASEEVSSRGPSRPRTTARTTAESFNPTFALRKDRSTLQTAQTRIGAKSPNDVSQIENFQGKTIKIKTVDDFYPDKAKSNKKRKKKKLTMRNNSSSEIQKSVREIITTSYADHAPTNKEIDQENVYLMKNYGYKTSIIDVNLDKYELPKGMAGEPMMFRENKLAIQKADKIIQRALNRNSVV